MKLYLAGADSSADHEVLSGLDGLALLVSYWYIKVGKGWETVRWAVENNVPLFLDSGAFSAMTLGAKIDLQEYIDFVLEHRRYFETVASLDVIGDHVQTWRNHLMMKEVGCRSIPTFHVNSPFSALEEMCRTEDYVALGVAGMQRRKRAIYRWLTKCFLIGKDVRFHGFALTGSTILTDFPWFSVDSSTWFSARRFGNVYLNNRAQGLSCIERERRHTLRGTVDPRILVKRNDTTENYNALLRHNAKQMLDFVAWRNRCLL